MAAIVKKDSVVAGAPSADQRKYLTIALRHLLPDHPKLHIPAVGQFTLVLNAIAAGYKPENIWTYDTNLYTGLLGNLIDPTSKPYEYRLSSDNEKRWDDLLAGGLELTPRNRIAFVFWVMKRAELEAEAHFASKAEDLKQNMRSHVDKLAAQIDRLVTAMKGIHFQHATVPDVVTEVHDADEVVVVSTPMFTGRAVRGFQYHNHIVYEHGHDYYSWRRTFPELYEIAKLSDAPYLWMQAGTMEGFTTEEIVYAKETRPDRIDYVCCSKPEAVASLGRKLVSFARQPYSPYHLPMWGLHDELRPDSKIEFVDADRNTVFYYRDLWAHKLGATAGDRYVLMLIDDKVYSAVIMSMNNFNRLMTQYLFEQSGFSAPSIRHPHLHRLLMWSLTCRQFANDMIKVYPRNRIYDPVGLETTCLSKYRKLKSNNGIFEVKFRERLEGSGMYRIVYKAEFREETYTDCIRRVLEEEASGQKGTA